MLSLHEFALYLHIAVGSCALLLFWVPMLTRKGALDHKRFGRYFAWAMYTVSFSGLLMSSLDFLFPLTIHAAGIELGPDEEAAAIRQVREAALFLFSLSVLVLASTRHGWLTILHKDDRAPLRRPAHLVLNGLLVVIGASLLITGINGGTILFMVFGGLQVASGVGNLRYIYRETLRPKEWWLQHLGGLIGAGIGAYTAFTVFGGRRFFEEIFSSNFDSMAIFLWVGPSVIGVTAITLLSRHYKKKFGGEWVVKRASVRSALFG
ncbi:MAG: hypothetical protein O2948_14265 [Proteobacteria bacterium]|nr:hypothetical protein [Pseudomonadota bacterium]MDA0929316.1 hypothetical protein [Pseudomonadota bacterium]